MLSCISRIDQPWKDVSVDNTFTLDISFNRKEGHQCLSITNCIIQALPALRLPFPALIYREHLEQDGTWRPHLHCITMGADHRYLSGLVAWLEDEYDANCKLQPLRDKERAYLYYTKQGRTPLGLEGWYMEANVPVAAPVPIHHTPGMADAVRLHSEKAARPTSRGYILEKAKSIITVILSFLAPILDITSTRILPRKPPVNSFGTQLPHTSANAP